MRKIIVIGECTLDIVFPMGQDAIWPMTLSARPAGRLLNAAAISAAAGHNVSFVGEAARDATGDLLVRYLESHGVDTHCIDRFGDGGVTSSNFIFPDSEHPGNDTFILNRHYPGCERFNAPWPRIDADDIVVFGGFFSLADRTRAQLTEILDFAAERHALILYLPGFVPCAAPNITRVMPAVIENLEHADIVLTRNEDLLTIYSEPDVRRCFERNIKFYCRTMINVDTDTHSLSMMHRGLFGTLPAEAATSSLRSQSAVVAALLDILIRRDITLPALAGLSDTDITAILKAIADKADGQ
ncbi:MAG: PfkB family carbohydrate kinase [Muribaculaceae bacterium]|nr:PfkB family carbohydrate kinase [Muribaculaceae bacterium]